MKEHEGSMCGGTKKKTFTMAWRRMEDGSDEEDTRFLEIQMWEGEEDEEPKNESGSRGWKPQSFWIS